MLKIGQINQLEVTQLSDDVIYFGHTRPQITLPAALVTDQVKVGDHLDVFVYSDGQGELHSSMEQPYAHVGEVAWLQVVSVTQVGAFLDWGIKKDLFVPFSEQKVKMREGNSYLVHVFLDEDNRVVGSSVLDDFISDESIYLSEQEQVDLMIAESTDLGFKAVVNHRFWGVLYKNEVFQTLKPGQKLKGYIKKIREDKRLDLCLSLKKNSEKADELTTRILDYLARHDGEMDLTDKSSPETISRTFGVSKKIFKQALGSLYKQRLVKLNPQSTQLIRKQ